MPPPRHAPKRFALNEEYNVTQASAAFTNTEIDAFMLGPEVRNLDFYRVLASLTELKQARAVLMSAGSRPHAYMMIHPVCPECGISVAWEGGIAPGDREVNTFVWAACVCANHRCNWRGFAPACIPIPCKDSPLYANGSKA